MLFNNLDDMALLFIEGFDHFSDATYMGAKGWNAIPTVSFQTGRVGSGQCLQQGSPSNHSNMTRALFGGATATTLFFGLGFRFSGTPSTTRSFFGFQTAAGVSCFALSLGSGNKLVVETAFNGSQVAVGTTTLTASTWYHIEGKLVINGASGSIRILFNGVEEIATTTGNFGSTAAGLVVLSNEQNSFMTWSWDDIYVDDSSGLAPRNSYLGDAKVETRFVTADGGYAEETGRPLRRVSRLLRRADTLWALASSTACQPAGASGASSRSRRPRRAAGATPPTACPRTSTRRTSTSYPVVRVVDNRSRSDGRWRSASARR